MTPLERLRAIKPVAPPPAAAPTTPALPTGAASTIRAEFVKRGLADLATEIGFLPTSAAAVLDAFITNDPKMLEMKQRVIKLADYTDPVIIFGESGTGKETIARALHGDRSGKFVAINCAAMPETLLESELFGHVAGAFTDAKAAKQGLFVAANDGTIFLDEIGEMPMHLQAKLLRALQEKVVRPVGSSTDVPINCRVVSATNAPLYELETGVDTKVNFRRDLYWRIAVHVVEIYPLRHRPDDIRELLDAKYDSDHLLSEAERDELVAAKLYGNCRELEARVKRIVLSKLMSVSSK